MLEKPTLSSPYAQYEELAYKIMLIGKSYSGKTAFIDSLCQTKINSSSLSEVETKSYGETPGKPFVTCNSSLEWHLNIFYFVKGINITHLYW